eukprot:CAMPEP_0196780568 /NCGR_PEP_ID=MMETSP1104-20130614/8049_1 /TAXON_ID=33652 /ORGANISM="Cafeteria sp., Strain Caron Lab Isolate" /LENGTH=244 /DNA_ID=CAMNT_0042150779 /DNA_START=86 /DNA_END=820 /DNA_ORIENTATION=+
MSHCCPTDVPAVRSDYEPKGSEVTLPEGGPMAYTSGSGNSRALIIVYDIFGMSGQAKQVCDKFADAGFNCIMPDFFEGKPWPLENFPPADWAPFKAWIGTAGSYDTVRPAIERATAYAKANGATSVGVLGFCWGAGIAMSAGASGNYAAVGSAHPSFITPEGAEALKCPMAFLLSKDEAPIDPIKAVLDARADIGSKCFYKSFPDMHHGWCAARGDWSDETQAKRATEAIGDLLAFFNTNMPSA